jgi:hypothetical protein
MNYFPKWLSAMLVAGAMGAQAFADDGTDVAPITARDFYNAGTHLLAATNFAAAERMFLASLAAQDEQVQPLAVYNLGHTRFADGLALYQKGPAAQKVSNRGRAALAAGQNAIREAASSLADQQMEKMVAAYQAGRSARRELRAAEKAVKAAMETYGKTLTKWQRSADDFAAATELNPADTNAVHNAKAVQQSIAKLVDLLQRMQPMAAQMAGQKQQLDQMLSKLKGQIPAPVAPPGAKGEDDEEGDNGNGPGEVKPESLAGQEEQAGRDGEQMRSPLSPDQAGQILDALPVDGSKRLPMGGDQEATPQKDRKGRNW